MRTAYLNKKELLEKLDYVKTDSINCILLFNRNEKFSEFINDLIYQTDWSIMRMCKLIKDNISDTGEEMDSLFNSLRCTDEEKNILNCIEDKTTLKTALLIHIIKCYDVIVKFELDCIWYE